MRARTLPRPSPTSSGLVLVLVREGIVVAGVVLRRVRGLVEDFERELGIERHRLVQRRALVRGACARRLPLLAQVGIDGRDVAPSGVVAGMDPERVAQEAYGVLDRA